SEFWLEDITEEKEKNDGVLENIAGFAEDYRLVLSGRTALDYIIQDLDNELESVYMPSYCCSSMLSPFKKNGIKLYFYEVKIVSGKIKYEIDFEKDVDIFFAMNYFGYEESNMDSVIKKFKSKEVIVIEDITHRLLSSPNHSKFSDYYIASLRKWFPIPSGGIALKKAGTFIRKLNKPIKEIINIKINAMEMKSKFIKLASIDSDTRVKK